MIVAWDLFSCRPSTVNASQFIGNDVGEVGRSIRKVIIIFERKVYLQSYFMALGCTFKALNSDNLFFLDKS